MTKEQLEREAGDYADKHAFRVSYDGSNKFYDDVDFKASKEGYLAGAEPREKQIEELKKKIKLLGERCNQLLADKGKLTDELDEWKAEWNDQVIKANEEGFARTKQTIQLSKAKDLLKKAIKNTWSIDYFVVDEINEFLKEN